ncbi:MAG: carboxypeptidase regulatory-like domain-containing protein [Gemmatimonadaceae bacterium]|nr:carboxypeptidase regulatory-like domain-containing protein [Gemmatimonadaceae bacterium]MCW5826467.1 carboxypeptidase regulatory-like domain-containing protein [Gemmatimonadaceae bacterium]
MTLSGSLLAAVLLAQGGVGTLSGRVTDADAKPVQGAIVIAQADGVTQQTRSDTAGVYALPGLRQGSWGVTARILGFAPDSAEVLVGSGVTRHDVRLQRVAVLGERVIAAQWTGMIGVVGSAQHRPLANASVRVVGKRTVETVNDGGGFAIPWPGDQNVVLRVTSPGYRDRLVAARVPPDGAVEVVVQLDSGRGVGAYALMADELQRRISWAGTNAAFVTREELLSAGTNDAMRALEGTPSFTRKGLVIDRNACLFVNGLPRPGFPLDSVDPETIEFIEVYPAVGEHSGVLRARWPRGAECGAPGSFRRRASPYQKVAYVVVWTRER